jgi:hypothetical protein
VHPAASLFPMMTEEELRELAEDIRLNGLRDPIVGMNGVILDGRNRLKACEMAGVEPHFRNYEGDDPYAFVISANVHRRNLTPSQLAAIAAIAREPLMEEARRRQSAAGKEYGIGIENSLGSIEPKLDEDEYDGRSRAIAARQFGVSHAQVGRAWRVKEEDPELFQKVVNGDVTVGAAHAQVATRVSASPPKVSIHKSSTAVYFGKGDRWKEATDPMRRYLSGQRRRGMSFPHVNPKEAGNRIAVIDELIEGLEAAKKDLEPRSHKASPFSV